MPESQEILSSAANNLIRAFDYLLEMARRRRRTIYRIAEHNLPCFYEHELISRPGIATNLIEADREVWIRLDRLQPVDPPALPDELVPWVALFNNPDKEPQLRDFVRTGPGIEDVERSEDRPDIRAAFEEYRVGPWRKWADEERPRRESIVLYDRMFALAQAAEAGLDTDSGLEVCMGVGIATWRHPSTPAGLLYPLIIKHVEISLDQETMALEVMPTDREPEIALDAYFALGITEARHVEEQAKRLLCDADVTFSPFDRGSFEPILLAASSRLDPHGLYWPTECAKGDRNLPRAADNLRITDTWVLFARPRTSDFIAADIERLKKRAEEGAPLTEAARIIVTEPPNEIVKREHYFYRGISNPGERDAKAVAVRDLFFPKPFNAAQVSIVERLDQSPGVVVQGPPGTGKTHTIANIICHYLALGKRILVTAQHEAPLAVLREQLPAPLRPLAISLLTSEREGLKQLEHSVRTISAKVNGLDEPALKREIVEHEQRINQLHESIAANDHELRRAAEPQLEKVHYMGAKLFPMELALRVIEGRQRYSWFSDRPTTPLRDTQLVPADVDDLRSALTRVGRYLAYIDDDLVDPESLPSEDQIRQLHQDLQQRETLKKSLESRPLARLKPHAIDLEHLRSALGQLDEALRIRQEAWSCGLNGLLRALQVDSAQNVLWSLLDSLLGDIDRAERERTTLLTHAVVVPANVTHDDRLLEAVQRASNGKRPFGFLSRDKETQKLFAEIRVGGSRPNNSADWKIVERHLLLARSTRGLMDRWNQVAEEFGGPMVSSGWPDNLRSLVRFAKSTRDVHGLATHAGADLNRTLETLLSNSASVGDWWDDGSRLSTVRESIELHIKHIRLDTAAARKADLAARLAQLRGDIYRQMHRFFAQDIGAPHVDAATVGRVWSQLYTEACNVYGIKNELSFVRTTLQRLHAAGAIEWAERIRAEGSPHAIPPDWKDAWEWAWADGYLKRIDSRNDLKALAETRQQLEQNLSRTVERLVEARTWLELKSRLTRSVSAALNAYLSAIARIGRGTGVRAASFRRDARQAMLRAQSAVPVWIMPHWRVSEALPPDFGAFDLVIIDEASQSDAWALPAIVRAKKMLIVGDDKQVSPSDVGIAQAEIDEMRRRLLRDLPYGQHLLPGSSIYDLGSTMFASDIIRLREHFRCVEPIIQFSNREFYDNEIVPLRIPKPSERIDPPLVDMFVKGGYRDRRRKLNRPEAEAIVDEIRRIAADPTYAKRTIGVVSLLGYEQAHYIQNRLIDELGEDVFLRHQIRCGDAMHFQGKEADIVFVSMVDAGATIRSTTGRVYEQRYNVACSRARDRLYVVHSFSRDQLKENDLKARLLDHLRNPLPGDGVTPTELRSRCESDFERAVFDELVGRGYAVLPQVRAAGYRIDLVVEGGDDRRLAIECDGDQYHGPDRWLQDLRRQRVLERIGWRFWRCWGSAWTVDKQGCLTDLLETIEQLGIRPTDNQGGEVASSLVEFRVIEAEAESGGDEEQASWVEDIAETALSTGAEAEASEDANSASARTVEIGAEVVYRELPNGRPVRITIVAGESEPDRGFVNYRAPLARALLGWAAGDTVNVSLPGGASMTIEILEAKAPT